MTKETIEPKSNWRLMDPAELVAGIERSRREHAVCLGEFSTNGASWVTAGSGCSMSKSSGTAPSPDELLD